MASITSISEKIVSDLVSFKNENKNEASQESSQEPPLTIDSELFLENYSD